MRIGAVAHLLTAPVFVSSVFSHHTAGSPVWLWLAKPVVDVYGILQPALAHVVGVHTLLVLCGRTCWVIIMPSHGEFFQAVLGSGVTSGPPADHPFVMAWWCPQAHSMSGCNHMSTPECHWHLPCSPCGWFLQHACTLPMHSVA
jgi:hypothetical protein